MLAHLRAVDGVTRVSLSKSVKDDTTGSVTSACAGKNPPTFSAVVFFERSAALAAFAPPTTDAASATNVPVPTAIEGKAAPAAAGATGNSAQAQTDGAAPTTTSGTDAP
jgi:hypothetical protein